MSERIQWWLSENRKTEQNFYFLPWDFLSSSTVPMYDSTQILDANFYAVHTVCALDINWFYFFLNVSKSPSPPFCWNKNHIEFECFWFCTTSARHDECTPGQKERKTLLLIITKNPPKINDHSHLAYSFALYLFLAAIADWLLCQINLWMLHERYIILYLVSVMVG